MIRPPENTLPSVLRSSVDAFCGDLIEGMHAMSQPLTILRGSFGATDVAGQSIEDLRKLVRRSAREVERVCVLFNYLRQFVEIERLEAEPEIQDLSRLLGHAVEGVDLLFVEAGVGLNLEQPGGTIPNVLIDGSRLEQAVCGILLGILGLAGRGNQVVVTTTAQNGFVRITFSTSLVPVGPLVAETKLSMALAAANLRSQGGNMTWRDEPLFAQIILPITDTSFSA